jgi:hypothetical protein
MTLGWTGSFDALETLLDRGGAWARCAPSLVSELDVGAQ